MWQHCELSQYQLKALIKTGQLTMAGNSKLRIYGRLRCFSGRRMHAPQRVFFEDETEALQMGFRPCGHCMKEEYRQWLAKQ